VIEGDSTAALDDLIRMMHEQRIGAVFQEEPVLFRRFRDAATRKL
jgi:hypothetical protein